jgi:lipopolysaccharide transport system ATP-binding protein
MSYSGLDSGIAVRVESVSKRYFIGARQAAYQTLQDQLMRSFSAPFRRTRDLLRGHATGAAELSEEIWALKDISFEVPRGEVLGIIGQNGAGKSTLLKILSRITEPTEGYAVVGGRMSSLLEVGTGFHPELTGRENTYLNGAILGMKRAEIDEKFDEIVDFSGVEKFIDTPVKHYSSGMRVRLAFAVAAHLEPEILVIDEVLSVGDAAFQQKCLGKMDTVARSGRTVLFVSHNLPMVEHLCGRALLLREGRLVEEGSPAEVIGSYLAELPKLAAIPLRERTDRRGAGEVRATGIELLDANARPLSRPRSGEALTLRMHYEGPPGRVFRNCRVGIAVNKDARPFFLLGNDLVGPQDLELEGDGFVDFTIPELPLSGGVYTLGTFIESSRTIQDWVETAVEMTVEDADFFGSGRTAPPGHRGKHVLVRHTCTAGDRAVAHASYPPAQGNSDRASDAREVHG